MGTNDLLAEDADQVRVLSAHQKLSAYSDDLHSCGTPSSIPGLEHPELPVGNRLEAGRFFEDIQESSRAIDSVTLRIAYPFYDIRTFQSFDGALRGRKRDR